MGVEDVVIGALIVSSWAGAASMTEDPCGYVTECAVNGACETCGEPKHGPGYGGHCVAPYHRPPINEQRGRCSRCGAHPWLAAPLAVCGHAEANHRPYTGGRERRCWACYGLGMDHAYESAA